MHRFSTLLGVDKGNTEEVWERTNEANPLRNRQNGNYYACVKVNGKEKWKSLKSNLSSATKLECTDFA